MTRPEYTPKTMFLKSYICISMYLIRKSAVFYFVKGKSV